ncbi:MAG TPA: AAA family ATPase [Nocardioides sp.]|nr:AAA family ATPase [Nocardioides sp.]
MNAGFVGRRDQILALEAFLEEAPVGPRSLCLVGDAGIGKTALWTEAVRLAGAAGFVVLTARAARPEAHLAFAAMGDLFTPVLGVTLEVMPTVQRRAIETALLLREPSGPPPDARVLGLALLSAVRELVRERPMLIAVDDVQWLDEASAEVLSFMLRRLEHEPAKILLTVRGNVHDAPSDLIGALPDRHDLTVRALPLDDTHRLLKDRLELHLSRPQLVVLHRAAGGNPFLALELGRAVAEGDVELTDGPIVLPPSVTRLVSERLQRLGPSTLEILVAVAALAAPTLTLLEPLSTTALTDIELAGTRGIVVLEGDRIRFAHPLLASACYTTMPLPRRRRLHERLAALDVGLEERARHLAIAASGPDDEVASSLDSAATHASTRGAVQAAAEFGRRAVALTPPRAVEQMNRRRIEAAKHCRTAGDPALATFYLQSVIDSAQPGPVRAHALGDLADVRGSIEGFRIAENLYLLALGEPGLELGERARLLGELAWQVSAGGYRRESTAYAESGLELAERSGDAHVLASSLAGVAELTFWRTGRLRRDLLDRAVEIELEVGRDLGARGTLARLLARCDRHVEARALFVPLVGAARTRDGLDLTEHLLFMARMELAAGAWPTVQHLCEEAIALAGQVADESIESLCGMLLAELDAYRGRPETARREIPALRQQAEESGFTGAVHRLSRALGSLELACDDPAESLRHVGPLCAGRTELNEVQAELAGSVAIEAMVGTQDLSGAERLLAQLDELAAAADAPLQMLADRSRGHILAARGDNAGAIRCFERAAVAPDPPQGVNPFESARTLLGLGTTLRRAQQKRAARDTLRQAVDGFEQLGAAMWAAKARSELRRIGGRTASDHELSETETLIAHRVAAGLRNREVAADLHLSPNTVSWNLSKIYRKLGVSSRTELAAHLARTPPS